MARPQINNRIFAVLMIITQIIFATMNGIFIRPKDQNTDNILYLTPQTFFQPVAVALLTVLGFGLIFSYNKRLLFSGLGFAFFIFALIIQLYPLVNAFWTKTQIMGETIQGVPTPQFNDDIWYSYFLNRGTTIGYYQNHLVSAFKCAIAIIVAFSCILGRAGLLQIFIMTIIGTFGYEFNRQLCYRKFQTENDNFGDPYGTMNVFVFGGFMGLAAALFLLCRQRKPQKTTARHVAYSANNFSAGYALFGTAILSIALPFLILDWHRSGNNVNSFSYYTPILCVLFSISGSTISSISLGMIFYGQPIVRHLVYGPVAGAVIGGASSYYTSNPVYAIVVGVTGGILQTIFMSIQQYLVNSKGYRPITTVSFTLFGIQGFVGSAFAVCWKEIIQSNSNGLPYTPLGVDSSPLILYGLICAGIGAGFGLAIGFLIFLSTGHLRQHQFLDEPYWLMEDGISDVQAVVEVEEYGSEQYYQGDQIKNQHAYL